MGSATATSTAARGQTRPVAPSVAQLLARFLARSPRRRFCLGFAAGLALMTTGFEIWQEPFSRLYLQPLCMVATAVLKAIGVTAALDTTGVPQGFCTISMARTTFRVIHECTGIFTLFIYVAAVLAYPASRRARLAGALGGTVAFFLYSAARLVLLGVVGHLDPAWIAHVHAWLMVAMNLGFALFVWLWWVERVGHHERH